MKNRRNSHLLAARYFNRSLELIAFGGGGGGEDETGVILIILAICQGWTLLLYICYVHTTLLYSEHSKSISQLKTIRTQSASSISDVCGMKTLTDCSRGRFTSTRSILVVLASMPCSMYFHLAVRKTHDTPNTPLLGVLSYVLQ